MATGAVKRANEATAFAFVPQHHPSVAATASRSAIRVGSQLSLAKAVKVGRQAHRGARSPAAAQVRVR